MFKEILKYIDFDNSDALLFVNQKDDVDIGETRRKILYLAQDDYSADAVFFQIKENNKYIPQFFLFDNTSNKKFSAVKLSEIHKRLWSSEIVPLYFVFEKEEIKIYNTKERVNINEDKKEEIYPTDILEISKKVETEFQRKKNIFSPFLFQNGSFWETEHYIKNYLKASITKESPFDILISNLHELKKDLIKNIGQDLSKDFNKNLINLLSEQDLPKELSDEFENFLSGGKELTQNQEDRLREYFLEKITNKIVVFSILIKYLEEKKDKNNKSVFTVKGNLFQKKWNVEDYSELIKKGEFSELLNYLSERFNGKIFEMTKAEDFLIKKLPLKSLNILSIFVSANYKNKNTQLYLWRLYSFQFLPVELISRIYEEFIPDTAGVVYTPPFLVDLLVDECMPLDGYGNFSGGNFKVIDPACGSGIFCVSAYQRLIDWHVINKYKKTKKWNKDLKIETLKKILVENIFGVDKEQEAVNIAVFSLILALLEKLTPIQLWEDLDFGDKNNDTNKKFNNLKEKNIKHDNFFNYLQTADNDFDLVIGNPPFIKQNFNKLEKDYKLQVPKEIPANLSILFLDQSIKLLKDNGLQCLILPSPSILYNVGAMKYRNYFFENYTVLQIIDFTHLRRQLFNKDVATCAFFAKKQTPEKDNQILHLISHRTANEENKMFFVFDTYDFHFIPLNIALTQKYIWKSNLVGGGRLNWIVNRLSKLKPTLGKFLEEKKLNGWSYGEGYILGKRNKDILNGKKELADELTWLRNNYQEAEWLFEKPNILKKDFANNNAFETNILKEISYFQANRKINNGIFKSPHLVIHYSSIDKINLIKNTKYKELIFDNMFCGIHFNNESELLEVYNYIIKYNKILSLNNYLISSKLIVQKEGVIIKSDIDNFPYPQTEKDRQNLQLSEVEAIWQEDVFNYYIHQGKASKNNPLNKSTDEKIVQEYADTFTWLMNLNYNPIKGKSFKTEKITVTNSYIVVEFNYCKENIETNFEKKTEAEYQNYFEKQIGRNKKITRIVEFIDFANNKIYYIKPLQNRYWLKSIADRDAMKCFADFGNNVINSKK